MCRFLIGIASRELLHEQTAAASIATHYALPGLAITLDCLFEPALCRLGVPLS